MMKLRVQLGEWATVLRGRRPVTRLLPVASVVAVTAALAAILTSGCNGIFGPRACTLIGCSNGLEVELQGVLPPSFTVAAQVGGAAPWTMECTPAQPCGSVVMFPEFTPDHVFIAVLGEGVDVQREIRPTYRAFRPNGDDCPPVCRNGRVTIQLN